MNRKTGLLGLLPITDIMIIAGIFMAGFWFRHTLLARLMGTDFRLSVYHYLLSGFVLGAVQTAFMAVFNVYRSEFGLGMIEEIAGIAKASFFAVVFTLATTFITRQLLFSRFVLIFSCPVSIAVLALWHGVFRKIVSRQGQPSSVLIVGRLQEAKQLGSFMETRAQKPYKVMGYADPESSAEDIRRLIRLHCVSTLVIAERSIPEPVLSEIILACEKNGIHYKIAADVFSLVSLTARVAHFGGTTLVESVPAPLAGWGMVLKRASDIVMSALLILMLAPVYIITAIAIVTDTGWPVFYRQTRLGRHNAPFQMIKFRSMRVGAHKQKKELRERNESTGPLFKMKSDPRVTLVGRFIRRWSIDELPQLLNVLAGKMSLVGPRPPLPEEVEEYSRRDLKRLHTIPGVTGIWQVSGRSELSFDEMVKLDLYYVDNWSIWLDIAILLLTPKAVLAGTGAY